MDLFCGVGGLTCGLEEAGLDVVAGYDLDASCEYTYTHNNRAIDDGKTLNEAENIHALLIGLAVDYLTRFMMGTSVEEAFKISLQGALCLDLFLNNASGKKGLALGNAKKLLKGIKGLDNESISNVCKLVGSLTDIAKYKNPDNAFIVVANWMRNHSTISFLGLWEQIHNPNFKPIEFDRFKAESGDNAFTLTPQQWIKATDAIGIVSKSGRYGGTYAHTDIAFKFASWISPEFKH